MVKREDAIEGEIDELTVMRRIDNLLKKIGNTRARARVLRWVAQKWLKEEEEEADES